MDSNHEIDDVEVISDNDDIDDSISVDDFIRQLEAKEKDLHITLDTTIIEIEQGFDDGNPSNFLREDDPSKKQEAKPPPEDCAETESDAEGILANQIEVLQNEIVLLRDQIAKLEKEREEMFANSQRRSRDFENFKTRTERERVENLQSLAGDLAARIIPAIDNLNRALDFAGHLQEHGSGEFRQFFDGIVLVNQQIGDIFSSMDIEPIISVGEKFDPRLHEAVATEETGEFPPNTVCEELLRGYRMGERIIRHSIVKVAVSAQTTVCDFLAEIGDPGLSDNFELETFSDEADGDEAKEMHDSSPASESEDSFSDPE